MPPKTQLKQRPNCWTMLPHILPTASPSAQAPWSLRPTLMQASFSQNLARAAKQELSSSSPKMIQSHASRINGPILTLATIIKFVMASASESELAALYLTAREMIPLRNALDEMGWPQPKSPIQTDNSTAAGFVNDTIIQRRIKMLWMRLHWLRCRSAQGKFPFYWDKGNTNLADYSTKHHPPAYHLAHRPTHAG